MLKKELFCQTKLQQTKHDKKRSKYEIQVKKKMINTDRKN
jgi:hypothetical protein